MKISLDKKKIAGGKLALRLRYYNGVSKTADGKTKYHRKYEDLELQIYANPKGKVQQKHNNDTLSIADTILSKRKLEVQTGKHGLADITKLKGSFILYLERLVSEKEHQLTKSSHSNWVAALKHLKSYVNGFDLSFEQINEQWLEGFKNYLLATPLTKSGTLLSTNSAASYFNKIRAALNQAQAEGIIRVSPTRNVKSIKPSQDKREYLTLDELKALVQTECPNAVLKRAFLFSCLTGMRWSDIQKLCWDMIQKGPEHGVRVVFKQQKTKGLQYLDLNPQALELMGEPGAPDQRVFKGLKYSAYMNNLLKQWVLKAGITRKITFHCARHTFATLQISNGIDIYVISKLLGHNDIKTTQIYADILDQHRQQAMHNLPEFLDSSDPPPSAPAQIDFPTLVQRVMACSDEEKSILKAILMESQ